MLKKITGLALVLSTVSTLAMAENLSNVLSYTYENSLTINAERAGLKATDESVARAKSGYRPSIIGQGSIGRSHTQSIYDNDFGGGKMKLNQDPNAVSINLVQPVFSGLSTYNSVEAAKQQVRSARSALFNTEQATLLDAVSGYMDVIRDKAVLDLQINNEKVLARHLESYKKRFNAGELTRTDVAQSEARLSGATANRIAAEGFLEVSNANYFSVIGLTPAKQMDDVTDSEMRLPKSLEDALRIAMERNPQIKAAEYAVQAAGYTVSAKKGALSPQIDITAGAGKQHEVSTFQRNDTWEVMANMKVPLYQSGAEYADIRAAKQTENQYRILLAKIKQDVRAQTISAWENYASNKAQIKSLKDQIKASKIALDGVIREAQVGSRTVLDVLDAEQEHLDNQVSLVKVHRDEIVSAYALLSAVGQLNPEDLKLDVPTYDDKKYYNKVKNKWFGYNVE
ncbi:MAG: TolC family outer membrane protein [Alphaproteobacteria bacterium]|nr:TolC family outer membrane protein [Alphaproteobacteria bacterium]